MIKSTLYGCIMGAFFASCATAADVPVKAPSVVRASSLFDWSMFAAGADLSYIRGKHESDISAASLNVEAKPSGMGYGGHVLIQKQLSNGWVPGLQLSYLGSSADDTTAVGGANVKEKIRELVFAEGRLGYAVYNVPYISTILPYLSFGLAAARSDATISGGGGSISSNKFDNYGWTIGAGVDTALTANVIWNILNVRYFDLGKEHASFDIAPGIGIAVPVKQDGFYVGTALRWAFNGL